MKELLRLRRTLRKVTPLLAPGQYLLRGGIAVRADGIEGDPIRRNLVPRPPAALPHLRYRVTGNDGPAEEEDVDKRGCDVVMQRGGCVILLRQDRSKVLRLYRSQEPVARIVANSAWLRRSFPCPVAAPLESVPSGYYGLSETFADGIPLRDTDRAQWESVFRTFLHYCEHHTRLRSGHLDPEAWFSELDGWSLPQPTQGLLDRNRCALRSVLEHAPLLRSHGDCHYGNLLVSEDGTLTLIDVERVENQPFFFDALSLLRGSEPVNQHLRHNYLHGEHDVGLARIWAAAGEVFRPDYREAYLLALVVAHAFRPQFAREASSKRREKFLKAMSKIEADLLRAEP